MRIAVIGSGISGLVAAYLLHTDHDVTVFEANDYAGGHTHTHTVECDGRTLAVDSGFIVYNERTYPGFVRLLQRLGVPSQVSDMSFSVRCDRTGLEYNPSTLNGLFAQRSNLLRPAHWRMIADILRFFREAPALMREGREDQTLGEFLEKRRFGRTFVDRHIVPLGSAIWSSDPKQFLDFPARCFVQFFHNHGMLGLGKRPTWRVVQGGSQTYVRALTRGFADRIRLQTPVESIRRNADHVLVTPRGLAAERFDRVIVATHSDQALALLSDPSEEERGILSAIRYQRNDTVLHTDPRVMPRTRRAWASWNYHVPREPQGRVTMTYHMNRLQSLLASREFCVTLNSEGTYAPDRVIRRMVYEHPVYTPSAVAAQRRHSRINSVRGTYFCGAYWGYGFHEDGVRSAQAVCRHFAKEL